MNDKGQGKRRCDVEVWSLKPCWGAVEAVDLALALGDPDGGPTAPTTNTTAAIPLRDGRNQILVKLTAVGRDAALRVSLV